MISKIYKPLTRKTENGDETYTVVKRGKSTPLLKIVKIEIKPSLIFPSII